jgi:carbamoyltransferase
MLVLGLSPFRSDASAALLQDGAIRAAVENHKLSRFKSSGIPNDAIRFCLEQAGARWDELGLLALATRPFRAWLRRSWLRVKVAARAPSYAAYGQATEMGASARELQELRILLQDNPGKFAIWHLDHHLCHAACAFFQSPFDRALIVTFDEDGDGYSGMVAIGQNKKIHVLRRISSLDSIAAIYSQVTSLIGFAPHREEHKTQWLGAGGNPEYKSIFLEMFDGHGTAPRLDRRFVNRGFPKALNFSERFYQRLGLPTEQDQISPQQRQALASSVQAATVEIVTRVVENLRRRHGITPVCLAGGLFQNSLLVASMERNLGFHQLFVPPAPSNAGTAVGAAYYAWHHILDKPRGNPVSQVYWGPSFTGQDVKNVLDNSKSRYFFQQTEESKLSTTIGLLLDGKVVGWVQGACEFGPRALGNRSVLASPWGPFVRENLNDFIKFREWFRPFAISVPAEEVDRYFECSQLCRFMNSLGWVRGGDCVLPDCFRLPGGYVRLHIVERDSNPLFWRLLKRFGEHAPAPMLVNTSFNLFGDPLVVTPRDAIRGYYCSGIDALVVDNFILSKQRLPEIASSETGRSRRLTTVLPPELRARTVPSVILPRRGN